FAAHVSYSFGAVLVCFHAAVLSCPLHSFPTRRSSDLPLRMILLFVLRLVQSPSLLVESSMFPRLVWQLSVAQQLELRQLVVVGVKPRWLDPFSMLFLPLLFHT